MVWPTRYRPIALTEPPASAALGELTPIAAREDRLSGRVEYLFAGASEWISVSPPPLARPTPGDRLDSIAAMVAPRR